MFVKKIKKNCFVFFIIIITSNAFELNKNVMQTWKNSTYYGFRGIKYAKSPTGSLRYKVSFGALFYSSYFNSFYFCRLLYQSVHGGTFHFYLRIQ